MNDPVVSRYGYHFERKAILQWLNDGNNYCPVSGNPLRVSNLVSDSTLKWKINYWAKKHGQEIVALVDENDNDPMLDNYFAGTIAIPDQRFFCPLTKDYMDDPVMSKTGHNFERKAILKWLDDRGDVCPVTQQPLTPMGLASNGKLKWEIGQWQLHHGDASKEMTKLELETKLSKAVMVSRDYHISDILRALTEAEAGSSSISAEEEKKQLEQDDDHKPQAETNVMDVLDEVVDALDA
jgi:hypothetical protein